MLRSARISASIIPAQQQVLSAREEYSRFLISSFLSARRFLVGKISAQHLRQAKTLQRFFLLPAPPSVPPARLFPAAGTACLLRSYASINLREEFVRAASFLSSSCCVARSPSPLVGKNHRPAHQFPTKKPLVHPLDCLIRQVGREKQQNSAKLSIPLTRTSILIPTFPATGKEKSLSTALDGGRLDSR